MNRRSALFLLFWSLILPPPLLSADAGAPEKKKEPPENAKSLAPSELACLRDLVVLSAGRQKPLATHAREYLFRTFSSRLSGGEGSLATYLSLVFDPESWLDRPCLKPESKGEIEVFGRDLVSPRRVLSFWDEKYKRFEELRTSIQRDPRARSLAAALSHKLSALWDKVGRIYGEADSLAQVSHFRFLPDPRSPSGEWLNPGEVRSASAEGRSEFASSLEIYENLRKSYRTGDADSFRDNAERLKTAQRTLASAARPVLGPGWVRLELLYYAVDYRWVALAVFAAAVLLYLAAAVMGRGRDGTRLGKAALTTVVAGALWNLWVVGGHTAIAGRLPLKNLQEVYLVVLFFVPVIGLLLNRLLSNPIYSAMAAALSVIGYVGSLFLPAEGYFITPLVAILHSPWREIHILTIMLSYAILLVAAALHGASLLAVTFRAGSRTTVGGRPTYSELAEDLNRNGYYLVAWGFLFLSVGIATGAAWGNSSWGRYWGWDPKEVWAAVSWSIYALFLHLRLFFRVRRELLAVISLLGYAAILFTYFGVTYVLQGLHSYT